MADHCLLFSDLLTIAQGRQRTYQIHSPDGLGIVCVDASLRQGSDWYFGRTWVFTRLGLRSLYRLLDEAEERGFRLEVRVGPQGRRAARAPKDPDPEWSQKARAHELHQSLPEDERRIQAELFPEEVRLFAAGYDWDSQHVYKDGAALGMDMYGRRLDTHEGVLYEWVRVVEEFTWRRYPLARIRVSATVPGS